ncbi:hypothetical protein BDF14DRAFT_1699869, partial [Spinellus fusiger]
NEFNKSGGKELPGFKRSSKHDNCGRPPILIKEYIQFLTKYIDSNTVSTVDLAHDELFKAFPGLGILVNAVYKHMRTKYKENNVDYQKSCVFIDKAGFNLPTMQNRA